MNKKLFALLIVIASTPTGCSLDPGEKTACASPSDCLSGYECSANNVCVLRGATSGVSTCSVASDCLSGYECSADNVCVLRGATSGVLTPSLQPPSNLQGIYVGTDYRLMWQDNSQTETGFEIQHSIGSDADYSLLAATAANTTQYVTIFLKNEPHRFRVQAVASDGRYSDFSNVLEVDSPRLTVDNARKVPSRPIAEYTCEESLESLDSRYVIKWKPTDFRGQASECGYRIYSRHYTPTGSASWDSPAIATFPQGTLSYEVEAMMPTEYGVAAFNEFGESEYATVVIDSLSCFDSYGTK